MENQSPKFAILPSTRRFIRVKDSKVNSWLRSFKDISDSLQQKQLTMHSLIQSSRLLIDADALYCNMGYPLKQGNSILKLLDQAIWILRELNRREVEFDHRGFFRGLFRVEEDEEEEGIGGVVGTCSDLGSPLEREFKRKWDLEEAVEMIKDCKRGVILEQIAFMIRRIEMSAFIGEVKPIADRLERHSRQPCLKPLFLDQNQPTSSAQLRISNLTQQRRGSSLYGLLRQTVYPAGPLLHSDKPYRIFHNGNYNVLWNSTTKQYHKVLREAPDATATSNDGCFIDQLNTKLKVTKAVRQNTSLVPALSQNLTYSVMLMGLVVAGVVAGLAAGDGTLLTAFLTLTLLGILIIYVRIANQPIFSNEDFRNEIKMELRTHFEVNASPYVFDMQEGGFDIAIIEREQEGSEDGT